MNTQQIAEYFATKPTAAELSAVLGSNWAVCRKTAKNMARYSRCLTPKEFAAAKRQALAARVQ
jgi:hypothetical protein